MFKVHNLDGNEVSLPSYDKGKVVAILSNDDLISVVFHKDQADELLEGLGVTYPYKNDTTKDVSRCLHCHVYGTIGPEDEQEDK